jgi:hypothetical protein
VELLFSYGTLQQEDVQLSLFGRLLNGATDELVQYEHALIAIDDPNSGTPTGKTDHAIARFTGDRSHRISGTVLQVTSVELARADEYEPEPYQRIKAELASGKTAWVYIDARYAPPQS